MMESLSNQQQKDRSIPRTDGVILVDTCEALNMGIGHDAALSADVISGVIEQSKRIVGRIIETYQENVAEGEVGPFGSGIASASKPKSLRGATGLLYGKVQSGKTLAMILTSALALDNGFKIIIVLTSDNVKLVEQTASRFQALKGARVLSSDNIGTWLNDAEHFKLALQDNALVLVTAKNATHLATFCKFLESIAASKYPALILDDEADQATLDTNTRKRAKEGVLSEANELAPSTIFDWTNGEFNSSSKKNGSSLRQQLLHHVYLQVTATPYALLLQNMDSKLRPSFTELLDPGPGYVGGEFFFSTEAFSADDSPLSFVDEEESKDTKQKLKMPMANMEEEKNRRKDSMRLDRYRI